MLAPAIGWPSSFNTSPDIHPSCALSFWSLCGYATIAVTSSTGTSQAGRMSSSVNAESYTMPWSFICSGNSVGIVGCVDNHLLARMLDSMDETSREYERVVDPKYLEQIREEAKDCSTKRLSSQSALAEYAIRSFKNEKNTIRRHSLRKLIRAIHDLHNKNVKD